MVELQPRKPLDRLPPNPMRTSQATPDRLRASVCLTLVLALLFSTSQYLSHFHVPRAPALQAAAAEQAPSDGMVEEHCTLCLQFDRLPAPPAAPELPAAWFYVIATLEAERLERLALDPVHLWPPSRGPPALTC